MVADPANHERQILSDDTRKTLTTVQTLGKGDYILGANTTFGYGVMIGKADQVGSRSGMRSFLFFDINKCHLLKSLCCNLRALGVNKNLTNIDFKSKRSVTGTPPFQ